MLKKEFLETGQAKRKTRPGTIDQSGHPINSRSLGVPALALGVIPLGRPTKRGILPLFYYILTWRFKQLHANRKRPCQFGDRWTKGVEFSRMLSLSCTSPRERNRSTQSVMNWARSKLWVDPHLAGQRQTCISSISQPIGNSKKEPRIPWIPSLRIPHQLYPDSQMVCVAPPIFLGKFADLRPESLPIYVLPVCRFTSDQLRFAPSNSPKKQWVLKKTAATILYILSYLSAEHLSYAHAHTCIVSFLNCLLKLLTLPSFIPYNILAFDRHGLIRCLERMPLGSVLIILVLILQFSTCFHSTWARL